jgi:hypothetical protein
VEIREAIKKTVLNKRYFPINLDVFVGLICEEPPFEGFYKYRRPRFSRVKNKDGLVVNYKFVYEFIIPYDTIANQDLVKLTKRHFIESLNFFDKIKEIDVSSLKQDMLEVVTAYKHAPVYLQTRN